MQTVIATKQGHDGLTVRNPGEVFQMPDGAKGSWFKRQGADKPDVPPNQELAHLEGQSVNALADGSTSADLRGKTMSQAAGHAHEPLRTPSPPPPGGNKGRKS